LAVPAGLVLTAGLALAFTEFARMFAAFGMMLAVELICIAFRPTIPTRGQFGILELQLISKCR